MKILKKTLAFVLTVALLMGIVPVTAMAAVTKPSGVTDRLYVGILNDTKADGPNAFPTEPDVTGYTYYYLKPGYSFETSWTRGEFGTNQAPTYINEDVFWSDPRIQQNQEGNAFGISDPVGLDMLTDPVFTATKLDEEEIVRAWMNAKGVSGNVSDYKPLVYVLKYEDTWWLRAYHLDIKVVKRKTFLWAMTPTSLRM